MKDLKEALINKKNIKDAIKSTNKWPNPFNIKKGDLKGKVKDLPIEIATLAIAYAKALNTTKFSVKDLYDVSTAFEWRQTDEGGMFQCDMVDGVYEKFYERYNPITLEKKLKEIKKLYNLEW